MIRWFTALALLGATLAAGCGKDSTPQCTPGESARCYCAEGEGAQTCQADGTFDECECGVNPNNTANTTTTTNNVANNSTAPNNTTANNTPVNNTTPTNNATNNTTSTNNATNNNTTPTNNNNNDGPGFCTQSCNVALDCAVFGDPAVWACVDNLCVLNSCTTDDACVRQMSNWKPGCNSSAQCGFGFECVTIDAANYCAFVPLAGFFECGELQLEQMMATRVDNGQTIAICGAPDAVCEQSTGNCFRPCTTDAECRPAGQQVGLVCIPETGQCGCTTNAHCTISGNICVEGECGCSGQAVCDAISAMAGIQFVCAP